MLDKLYFISTEIVNCSRNNDLITSEFYIQITNYILI